MARPVLLATTPRAGLRPLGAQGQTVAQAQQQIVALIASHLGPQHAALFAEPVADPARDAVAWYTTADGAPGRLAQAAPEAQQKAREAIALIADDIRKLAQEYAAAANPQQKQMAALIELAQSFPGEDCVFLVGEQPVVIAWGYAPAAATAAEPTTLTRYGIRAQARAGRGGAGDADAASRAAAEQAARDAAAQAAAHRARARYAPVSAWAFWLLFLVAGLVVGSGIAWAIKATQLPIVWTAGVPTVVSDPLADAQAAEAKLRQEIAELSIQVSRKQVQCTVPPAEPPPQKRSEAPSSPDLKIPADAARTREFGFLNGCWDTITDVHEFQTGEPLVLRFCFNRDTADVSFAKTTDGAKDTCRSVAEASFGADAGLSIQERTNATCDRDRTARYARWTVACRRSPDGLAYCTSADIEGSEKDKWGPVVLKRSAPPPAVAGQAAPSSSN